MGSRVFHAERSEQPIHVIRKSATAFFFGVLLVALYTGIRLLNLDHVVTTDEPLWLGRSANFYRALHSGALADTYQMAHPGVLTMWAGALAFLVRAPDYADVVQGNFTDVRHIATLLRARGYDPLELMVAAKVAKVLLQGVFYSIALVYLKRLFPFTVMILTGALIAFDPFLSGLDSALHVDGLFAIVTFSASLSLAHAARSGYDRSFPWIVAGVLAACAWMTRSTGAVLLIVLVMVLLCMVIRARRHGAVADICTGPIRVAIWWCAAAGLTSIALLPAFWVQPVETMINLALWPLQASIRGHENPTFFMGEIYQGDLGVLFYPVSLMWRLTPVTISGLLLVTVFGVHGYRRGWITRDMLYALSILLTFTGIYVLGMTVSAKKFDRYILVVYPVVDLLAAVGFTLLIRQVSHWWASLAGKLVPAVILIIVFLQMISTIGVMPYRLDYYNPVLGGAERARNVMQLGWGQGGDQAMAFIVEDAQGQNVTVLTSDFLSSYEYFAPESISFVRANEEIPDNWRDADYIIVSIQQSQRHMDQFFKIVDCSEPGYVAEHENVEFVKVFRVASLSACPAP